MWRSCDRCISLWCELSVSEVGTAPGEELSDISMLEHLLPAKTISETQIPTAQNSSHAKFAYFGWQILFLLLANVPFFVDRVSHRWGRSWTHYVTEADFEPEKFGSFFLQLQVLIIGKHHQTGFMNCLGLNSGSSALSSQTNTLSRATCTSLWMLYSDPFHWSFQSCFFQSTSEKSYTSSKSGSAALSSANLRQLFLRLFPWDLL